MLRLPELLATADWVIPAISGGAAILGALVGGAAAGWFTLKGEDKRQAFAEKIEERKEQREDEARLAVARGAAREWVRVLAQNEAVIGAALTEGRWWASDIEPRIFDLHEDRKLVASMLSANEFSIVKSTEFALAVLMAKRKLNFERHRGRDLPAVAEDDLERIANVIVQLKQTRVVLGAVGGTV